MQLASSPPSSTTLVLLLCHATGFCKEVWKPHIDALRKLNIFSQIISFDFSYHGSNYKKPAKSTDIPWTEWGREDVMTQVNHIKHNYRNHDGLRIIGVGHSFGGACLALAEERYPDTFYSLILFEPPMQSTSFTVKTKSNILSERTRRRRTSWVSFEEAESYFLSKELYASFHPSVLKGYLQGALRISKSSSITLCCSPEIESTIYETLAPLSKNISCPTVLITGAQSTHFKIEWYRELLCLFVNGRIEVIENATHFMPLNCPFDFVFLVVKILHSRSKL